MRAGVVGHIEWIEFAHVDHVPVAGEIVHACETWEEPGGGGAVAAVQLAKLSGGCDFFTAVGDDELGRRSVRGLEALGVSVHTAIRDAPTRRAVTFIDRTGERTITTLGARLQPVAADPLPWPALAGADGVYVSAGDPGAFEHAREARVLVVTARALDLLAASGVHADAIVGSGRDAAERYDSSALASPPGLAVRTAGARGGTYEIPGRGGGSYPPAPPPGPIADTYGGGDSFVAGLTFALGSGLDVDDALALAARCGAHAVTGRGPYAGQLTAIDL
ncbi:MAG TPA: PfkB family carbohydrate kinase [Actinomycetota bacterium]|jgi:ribokinase|nr:PfkB family carbohydrate kinase [Actinomycetota bacterium]